MNRKVVSSVVLLVAFITGVVYLFPAQPSVPRDEKVKETTQTSGSTSAQARPDLQEISDVPSDASLVALAALDVELETGGKENVSGQSMKKNMCEGKETGTLADYDFKVYSADLNGDGVAEIAIKPFSVCTSIGFFRGASDNGPYLLIGISNGAWRSIGTVFGNSIEIAATQTSGFYDIETSSHLSVDETAYDLYRWDPVRLEYVQS